MKFRALISSLVLLCAPSAWAQAPGSPFGQGWLLVSDVHGDAPLFANERAQLAQAVHSWAAGQGARLMPADSFERLPANRCAASAIEKAPLEVIYPQVGEIGVGALCVTGQCKLRVWVTGAGQDASSSSWESSVPSEQAHEVALWLEAVSNLRQVSNDGGAPLGRLDDSDQPLMISNITAYGTTNPVYKEDFEALEHALQICHAPKSSGLGQGESILLATVAGGQVSGCEADVDLSLDRSGARASCLCRAAKATTLPKQLHTTGRARVRIDLFNRASKTGPTVAAAEERPSPNFVKAVDSSFTHFLGSVQNCFAQHPVALPDERDLRISVNGSGHLLSAHLTGGGANPALTQCLTAAIRQARFPCTEDNQNATYQAKLRTTLRRSNPVGTNGVEPGQARP